jgi:hypothetical protein
VLQGLGVILEVQRDLAEEFVYFQVSAASQLVAQTRPQALCHSADPCAKHSM